jgi:sporulation protein YlmC with PRC-barrel domain
MTTPATPAPRTGAGGAIHLSELLRHTITDNRGEPVGKLADVIVRLQGTELPQVTGLVATVGKRQVFVPVEQLGSLGDDALKLTSAGTERCCCGLTCSGTGS